MAISKAELKRRQKDQVDIDAMLDNGAKCEHCNDTPAQWQGDDYLLHAIVATG